MKATVNMMRRHSIVALTKLYLPADIADPWHPSKEKAVTDTLDIEWWVRGSTEWAREVLKVAGVVADEVKR